MSNLIEPQKKLLDLVQPLPEQLIKNGSTLFSSHPVDGYPSLFYLTPTDDHKIPYQLTSDLNLQVIQPDQLRRQLFRHFYNYRTFTIDDLNLLMKDTGFPGYYVNTESRDIIVLFEPQDRVQMIDEV